MYYGYFLYKTSIKQLPIFADVLVVNELENVVNADLCITIVFFDIFECCTPPFDAAFGYSKISRLAG